MNTKKYRIKDVKVKANTVQLLFVSSDEEIKIQVSVDDYYEYGLRKDGEYFKNIVDELQEREAFTLAYQACVRKLSVKDRTVYEIRDYLQKNTKCQQEMISDIISRLKQKGYLDDERLCREEINILKTGLAGHDKIVRNLSKRGISLDLIEESLYATENDEEENALKYAQKLMRSASSDSVRKTKMNIQRKLILQGYGTELSARIAASLDYSQQELDEMEHLRKCAAKAARRYGKKYQGTELRNHIYRYCVSQGYHSSDIYSILDEME